MNERRQPARSAIVDGFLPLWAFFPLKVLQVPVVRTCSLRNWNPRPACGTAFSSVHPILSVCVCVSHSVPRSYDWIQFCRGAWKGNLASFLYLRLQLLTPPLFFAFHGGSACYSPKQVSFSSFQQLSIAECFRSQVKPPLFKHSVPADSATVPLCHSFPWGL